ncbi:hypothetical protein ACVIGB_000424 [Bradyrhizobium sp. USDA 4341]
MTETLIDIPFFFEAQAVRRHCRNEETTLLRGSVPIAFPCIEDQDAPVALEISIRHISEPKRADKQMHWRRDARSYLRPVNLHVGPSNPPQTFDYRSEGKPATAGLLGSLFSFNPEVHVRREELPNRWVFAGHPKLSDIRYDGQRHTDFSPSRVMTTDAYGLFVREWKATGEPAAAIDAIRSAEQFAFVAGILHRRVPPPVWRLSNLYPNLVHGEDIETSIRGPYGMSGTSFLWPTTLSNDFGKRLAAGGETLSRQISASVEYRLDPDEDADLAAVGRLILKSMHEDFKRLVPYLTDENLDRFKIVRACYDAPLPLPLTRYLEGFECLADMLPDPAFELEPRHHNPRRSLSAQVTHWRRLLRAAVQPILDPSEEEALAILAS